jgi:hypothetical protein
MINLNSARLAWHDAFYSPWDSLGAQMEQLARLGCGVQETSRRSSCRRAFHQAVAGRIQNAIAALPEHLQAFGNHLYNPLSGVDDREAVEEWVWCLACRALPRMTARKFYKARFVACAVVLRYRRINQGGQGAGQDPLPNAEAMRKWILDTCGVALVGDQWARDWGRFVEQCFAVCDRLDREALLPVAGVLSRVRLSA